MSEENKWVTDLPDEDKNASAEQKPLTHPYSEGRRMQESRQDSYAGAGQSEGTSQEKPKYGHYEVHQPQAGNYAGGNIPPKKPRKKRDFSGHNSFESSPCGGTGCDLWAGSRSSFSGCEYCSR